jgi:hypothetical protein
MKVVSASKPCVLLLLFLDVVLSLLHALKDLLKLVVLLILL